jgi:hypothetical protein
MEPTTIILIVVILALIAVVGWLLVERRRSKGLQSQFGSEYRRTLDDTGDRRAAEAELEARQKRVAELEIRPLPQAQRDHFARAWREVQARFVDEPELAISQADDLIGEVMQARGYPVADFEQRVADVSVDHAGVVEHYRIAHAIADRTTPGIRDTEELRQAMVHYRALFEDLLEVAPETADGRTSADGRDPTGQAQTRTEARRT